MGVADLTFFPLFYRETLKGDGEMNQGGQNFKNCQKMDVFVIFSSD